MGLSLIQFTSSRVPEIFQWKNWIQEFLKKEMMRKGLTGNGYNLIHHLIGSVVAKTQMVQSESRNCSKSCALFYNEFWE